MIKNISLWPIPGPGPNIFLLDISKSGKNQLRVWRKISYSIFSNKHTWHSLKSRYPIIQRSPNDSTLYTNYPSHSESFNVVQIFQRCINHSRLYQFCNEVKNHSTLYKSFNVVQIIQRCTTNHSTRYKSFNVVQIFQRSKNHST